MPLGTAPRHARMLALLLAGALLVGGLWMTPLAALERSFGLAFLYAMRGERPAPDGIVIVAMNAASAKALGVPARADRWPRQLHATLVQGLSASGARAIGFDVLFARAGDAADDAAFAEAIREAGNVVLAEKVTRDFVGGGEGSAMASIDRIVPPNPLFATAASATAPFVLPKTPHGMFEFWTRVPTLGGRASLPAVLAGKIAGAGAGAPMPDPSALTTLNLYGPLGSVATIDFPQALAMLADPRQATAFAGKAVLVGYSEPNQSRQVDTYRTPYFNADGVDVSGVELCATALANLLDGSWLRRPHDGTTALLLMAHVAVLVLPWLVFGVRAALLLTVGIQLITALSLVAIFSVANLWLPVVLPLLVSPLVATGLGFTYQHLLQARRRRELERALDVDLPPQALARLSALFGGDGRGGTIFAVCLCSDIVSFTKLSGQRSPDATRDLLNAYLERFTAVVEAHGGYVAEMVPDSLLSLWVADSGLEQAVTDACRAVRRLDREMNAVQPRPGALPTRFGLHCGPIFYGAVGAGGRRELHAVGDIVNTTSRIESANKYLKTTVLVSRDVAENVTGQPLRSLGDFQLIGKEKPIELLNFSYDLLSAPAAESFAAGLEAFRAGDFERAASAFLCARDAGDCGPSEFYLEQCRLAGHGGEAQLRGTAVLPGK